MGEFKGGEVFLFVGTSDEGLGNKIMRDGKERERERER